MFTTSLLLLLLQGAPPPLQAIASTTADVRLPQDAICRDEAILRRDEADTWSRVHTPQAAWMAMLGDLDGDGLFDYPAGIDALTLEPTPLGASTSLAQFWFSSDRDFHGFRDGDILRMGSQGLEVVASELDLVGLLQPASGTVDVDALHRVGDGVVLLSLANNLYGTTLGDLLDGDVLEWDWQQGVVLRLHTEAEIQQMVDLATGGSSAIGDLKSLSRVPGTGALAFTVQSPTAFDATVVTDELGGQLMAGWEEDDWSFQAGGELDALAFVPMGLPQPAILSCDVPYQAPGSLVKLRLRHAEPGARIKGISGVACTMRPDFHNQPGLCVIDTFLLPVRNWPGAGEMILTTDSSGSAGYDAQMPPLPAGAAYLNVWMQAYQTHGGGWSSPIVLRLE